LIGLLIRKGTFKNKPPKKMVIEDVQELIEIKPTEDFLIGVATGNKYYFKNDNQFIVGCHYERFNQDGLSAGSNNLIHLNELLKSKKLKVIKK